MLVVLFHFVFSNRKILFFVIPYFLCLGGCLFQCVVSNFYHEDHKLIFRARHCMGNYRLICCGLGFFQVLLDVRNL